MQETTETHTFRIVDVGPHQALRITLRPGINCFVGQNGAGKTSALNAIVRASGGDAPVSVRRIGYDAEGEPITAGYGTVEGPTLTGSGILIRVASNVGKREAPIATLASYGNLHTIVDGDGKADPKVRDAARINAILTARPIPLDEELLNILTAGHQLMNPSAAALLIKRKTSILDVAEQLKAAVNDRALAAEKDAAQKKGAAEAARDRLARMPQPEPMDPNLIPFLEGDLEAIQKEGEELKSAADKAAGESLRRLELEELKGTLGERPDPASKDEEIARLQEVIQGDITRTQTAREELAALEHQVTLKKIEIGNIESERSHHTREMEEAKKERAKLELEASRYDSNLEKFSTIETLATPEQAAQAAEAYQAIRIKYQRTAQALKAEKANADRREALALAEEEARQADADRQAKANEAQAWRAFSKGTSSRIGAAMALKGIPRLTIGDDGRLYHLEQAEDGTEKSRCLFDERSYGQKVDTMLEIGSSAGDIFPLDPNFFFQLQPKKRLELAEKAKKHGYIIITEWPTDDPEIGILHFTGAEEDSAILQASPVSTAPMLTHAEPLTDTGRIDQTAAPEAEGKPGKKKGLEIAGSLFAMTTAPAPAEPAQTTISRRTLGAPKPRA